MSNVLKSNRGESPLQFLETARNLELHIATSFSKFGTKYNFTLIQHIVNLSIEVLDNAKAANSYFPRKDNEHEKQVRIDYVNKAIVAVEKLLSQLEIAMEISYKYRFEIKSTVWEEAGRLCKDELKLLKGLKKRYEEAQ